MLGASSYLLPGKILWDERPATNRKIFNCSLLLDKPRGTQLCVLKLVLKHLIKCQLKGLSEPGSSAGGSQPRSQDNPPPGVSHQVAIHRTILSQQSPSRLPPF